VCLRRQYCSPCKTDLDCSLSDFPLCFKAQPNQLGFCTRGCDLTVSGTCPWEGASRCGTLDEAIGPVCGPTYGDCVGNGEPCTPCRSDADCFVPGGHKRFCGANVYTHEPYCIDLDAPCKKDADCPITPGKTTMQCLGGADYEGSDFFERCVPKLNALRGYQSCYSAP
jgi:hypothetical protein